MGLAHQSLVSLCHSFFLFPFLPLSLFFRLIPWSTGALWVHFSAWASKTQSRRRSVFTLARGCLQPPWTEQVPCLGLYWLSVWTKEYQLLFFPLSFIHSLMLSLLRVPLDPAGAGPWQCSNYHTIALISHTSKLMLKILQAKLQEYLNHELPDSSWI